MTSEGQPEVGLEDRDGDEDEAQTAQQAQDEAQDEDEDEPGITRTWWIVGAAATIVVAGLVIGILVFNSATPQQVRGSASARDAATRFVQAVNAGNRTAAAAIACDGFADAARAAARAGEQGILVSLAALHAAGSDTVTAVLTEHLTLPGGRRQTRPADVSVVRAGGRWLICGQTS